MSHDLTFYTNPMSRGRIARWMLEEVGIPYDTRILDYGTTMKAAEYLAINPMGKVPCIVHRGAVVSEAAAICAYLADAFPDAGLAPALNDRADYYRWFFFAAGPVEAAVMNRALKVDETDRRQTLGYGSFDDVMNTLQTVLADRDYLSGNRFSAVDVYMGSQIGWGLQFGTMDARPGFKEYFERLSSRAAWARANELDNAAMDQT